MTDYAAILQHVMGDPRYQMNLDWGSARPGHPEGSIRAHIAELELNLEKLRHQLSDEQAAKVRLLIHTHDTFKPESKPNVAIADPASHASLAREFLSKFCDDADLLAMVQYHDEPFALWRQAEMKGECNPARLNRLISAILDWDVFLALCIVDGCTSGKTRQPLHWWFSEIGGKVDSRISSVDILQ